MGYVKTLVSVSLIGVRDHVLTRVYIAICRAFDWSFSSYFTRTKGKKLYALSPSMAEVCAFLTVRISDR